jgi:hypothetical protein
MTVTGFWSLGFLQAYLHWSQSASWEKLSLWSGKNAPEFLVKRLQKSHGGNFWVQGDNEESTDSRTWGWIPANEIVGVALLRIKKTRNKTKRN